MPKSHPIDLIHLLASDVFIDCFFLLSLVKMSYGCGV